MWFGEIWQEFREICYTRWDMMRFGRFSRFGEIWWNSVRYGEIWWDLMRYVRFGNIQLVLEELMRYGEIRWDMVRYGEIWWDLVKFCELQIHGHIANCHNPPILSLVIFKGGMAITCWPEKLWLLSISIKEWEQKMYRPPEGCDG